MGTFDSSSDIPNQIRIEGETITVTFSPGEPQSGQGTVRWNIPTPALGCTSESDGAYCGMVVLLNTSALTTDHTPADGTFYVGDPTADTNLHAGDKINGALVIGAFYEGEKKSRGEELTNEFVISGLAPKTPYYVIGYAVDCQGRYHKEGQRAYSADFGNAVDPGTPASQVVVLNDGNGVLPTDGTGLVPGMPYEFEIVVNTDFPNASGNQRILVSGNGEDFGTYQDLLDEINKAVALAGNPPQSPTAPDIGRYYWNGTALSQWDGTVHQPVDALIEPTDPADVAFGDYWYNPDTGQLQRFNIPNPTGWNPIDTLRYHKDPTTLFGGGDYWFDGAKAYSWCATTWCEEVLYITTQDPGLKPSASCGSYWYDTVNEMLFNWNADFLRWDEVFAINWDVAPNNLLVGTYWFDTTNEELKQYDGVDFLTLTFINFPEEPTGTFADGDLWYNPTTEVLSQWVDATSEWVEIPVLVWPDDPRDTESCELWWRSTDDTLFKWDTVNNEWDEVYEFIQLDTDPYETPAINYGDLWYNPTDSTMQRWDGIRWDPVTHIEYPTQPNIPTLGISWHDTANNKWYVWDTPNAGWNEINPIDADYDPLTIPSGTFWFDTDNDVLYERVGSSWTVVPYSTQPLYPAHGELWFDSINEILMQWQRDPEDPFGGPGQWIPATPLAIAELGEIPGEEGNHLIISTTGTGSNHMVMILLPEGVPYAQGGGIATGTAGKDCCFQHYGVFDDVEVLDTQVPIGNFLFENLVPPGEVRLHRYGIDGIEELPSYETIGIGTDGSPDERREILDWVRSQLGYPTIEVELTQKQIDEAVDMALETIRQRTALAYERCATFLEVQPRRQKYVLTNKVHGYDKIVTVTSAHRFTSAFLSTAHGAGVYGQIVLQHLYNMGTFDLLSYHLVSEYVEQLEHLFATRLVFHWSETHRTLSFYQSFHANEVILLDVMTERTEQAIMKDRWARTWIKRYALMHGMEILSQIRGKFATLPGAGGGISLNAADLMARADMLREELKLEVEDYIADDPEALGMHGTFILG